jgi:hypothetical protein
MAIGKLNKIVQFSNGFNKMAAENGLVLGLPVWPKIDHSETRLVQFSDSFFLSFRFRHS